MPYIKISFLITFLVFQLPIWAQDSTKVETEPELKKIRDGEYHGTTEINGNIIPILIIDGDTLPTISAPNVDVSRKRNFTSRDERRRYHKWRRYAAKVYPLALEAVRLYRQVEAETKDMKRRKKKKYAKNMEKNLTPQYEEQIRSLTKSQGYILIKMVERELDQPFYKVIRTLRGGWQAYKWQSMGRMYGYNLKTGYDPNEDEILEMILSDLDLSYDYDMYNTDWEKEDK